MPESWSVVFEGPGLEAAVVRAALEAAGIEVYAMGGFKEIPGLDFDRDRVYVLADQLEMARAILQGTDEEGGDRG
ncbi:MAG: DUF2007 domain-containing protein [Candidatus Dormibacteraeota bacterium]|nr:DUF2007 domain-containing protein [Candidatus Dormibacteraeota bacterium]